jgi:hypothetical protein
MGLSFFSYLTGRSTEFDANTEGIISAIAIACLFTPFNDSTILSGTGFKRRIIESEFYSGSGPKGEFSDKKHAVATHIVYFAIGKGPFVFILKQNRRIIAKPFAFSVINRSFHSSPPFINCTN